MIIQLKQKCRDKLWRKVKIDKLLNKSLAYFIAEEFEATICSVYKEKDDLVPMFVVANTSDMQEYCDKKNIPLVYASDMLDLLTGDIGLKLVAETFPDSDFLNIKSIEPEKEELA